MQNDLNESGYNGYFFPVKADLNNTEDIENLFSYAQKNFGHIDCFVGIAGVDLYKLLTDTKYSELDNIFNINVRANFILSKLCLKKMIERKYGKIIYVSSIWGEKGASMETAYSSSKFALNGLAKSLAKEVAPSNICVNTVCPGVIDTPMNSRFSKEEMDDLINRTPLKKLGKPEDVANLILYLASDKADFITGQSITIDGGFTV